MYPQSLVTVSSPEAVNDGVADQDINISRIHKQQLLDVTEIYYGLITDEFVPIEMSEVLDDSTATMLMALPAADSVRIISFVQEIMGYISEKVLSNNKPLNARHLQAYFAATYKKAVELGNAVNEELYIRLITALYMDGSQIGEISNYAPIGSSLQAIEAYTDHQENGNYYKDWNTRGAVGNTALKVIASTMPIVQRVAYDGNRSNQLPIQEKKFEKFQNDLLVELNLYKNVLGELYQQYLPGRNTRSSRIALPVFVSGIMNGNFVSNISKLTESSANIPEISMGITGGYDEVTGLPLTFTVLSYGWDQSIPPIQDQGPLMRNNIYTIAGIALHELIHEQAEIEQVEPFETYINELLTDSLRELIQLRAHGMEFTSENFEHRRSTGYHRLVRFSRDLIINKVITEADLIQNGLNQDPRAFVRAIAERARTHDGASRLIYSMQRQDMILPLASRDLKSMIVKCMNNPESFFEEEFNKAIEKFDTSLPMYQDEILDLTLSLDPDFIVSQKKTWSIVLRKSPDEIDSESKYLLLDSVTGVYHDRVVELYYQVQNLKKSNVEGYRLSEQSVLTLITDPVSGQYIPIFTDPVVKDELNNLTITDIISYILTAERVCYNYLDYDKRPTNKETLTYLAANMTERLYKGLIVILSETYPELDLQMRKKYINDLILSFAQNLKPIDSESRYSNPNDVIDEILGRVAILANPGLGDEGSLHQMTVPQIIHYGYVIGIDKQDVKKESEKIPMTLRR